jgi:hypothetical protein
MTKIKLYGMMNKVIKFAKGFIIWIYMGVVKVSSFPMIENNIVDEPRNIICLLKVKKT